MLYGLFRSIAGLEKAYRLVDLPIALLVLSWYIFINPPSVMVTYPLPTPADAVLLIFAGSAFVDLLTSSPLV
jgi:hypothetical protein